VDIVDRDVSDVADIRCERERLAAAGGNHHVRRRSHRPGTADLHFDQRWLEPKTFRQVPVSAFYLAKGKFDHMALAPMQVLNVCGDPYEEEHVYRFMLLASRLNLTFNSGLFARVDAGPVDRTCVALEHAINTDPLDPRTIYVVAPASVDRFKAIGAPCGRVDGDWICSSRDSDERFRKYLETGK